MRLGQLKNLVAKSAAAGGLQAQVEVFIAEARMLSQDGFTWAEIGHLFMTFIVLAVAAAEQLISPTGQPAAGADKKQAVLDAVAYLFDILAPAFPLPWFAAPFRGWITVRLRDLVLALADGAIEAAVGNQRLKAEG